MPGPASARYRPERWRLISSIRDAPLLSRSQKKTSSSGSSSAGSNRSVARLPDRLNVAGNGNSSVVRRPGCSATGKSCCSTPDNPVTRSVRCIAVSPVQEASTCSTVSVVFVRRSNCANQAFRGAGRPTSINRSEMSGCSLSS